MIYAKQEGNGLLNLPYDMFTLSVMQNLNSWLLIVSSKTKANLTLKALTATKYFSSGPFRILWILGSFYTQDQFRSNVAAVLVGSNVCWHVEQPEQSVFHRILRITWSPWFTSNVNHLEFNCVTKAWNRESWRVRVCQRVYASGWINSMNS